MITTIFFDLGNVLAEFNWTTAAQRIARDSRLTPDEVYKTCTGSTLASEYETGKITTSFFFDALKKEIGFKLTAERLHYLWSDIFTPITKNVALLDKIRKTYPVGLISNTNEAHVAWIEKQFGFLKWFPHPTYSYLVGCMKPQKEIFISALNSHSLAAQEGLFIDDLEINVLSARNLGMQAIHFTPEKDMELELKRLGINRNK